MSILITAMALAAAQGPAAIPPAAAPAHSMHAQPTRQAEQSQQGGKPHSEGCACCKDMASGGKMECCAKYGEHKAGEHSDHGTSR